MKPKRQPPPPPPLPPPPWLQMPTILSSINKSPKAIKKPLIFCQSCVGFLTDWLLLPPHKTDYWASKVKYPVLKRIASPLARIYYRCIQSMTQLDTYVINNTVSLRISIEEKKLSKVVKLPQMVCFLEELTWLTILEAVNTQKGNSDMDHVKALIQDSGMIRSSTDCDLWIGHVLWNMWTEIPKIHMEHRGLTDSTGGGPAFGMKSYTPAPRPSPNTHVSAGSPRKSSVSSPPPLLGSFDDVDLYV